MNEYKMVQTFSFYIISLLLLYYLFILSMPQVFEQSLFLLRHEPNFFYILATSGDWGGGKPCTLLHKVSPQGAE